MRPVLLYAGAALVAFWGVMHLVKTAPVVAGFGPLSPDKRRILTMEWIGEGVTLCFIALLVSGVALLGNPGQPEPTLVYRMAALMLLVMAGVSLFTGARTSQLPYKLCPPIFTAAAVLFLLGGGLGGP